MRFLILIFVVILSTTLFADIYSIPKSKDLIVRSYAAMVIQINKIDKNIENKKCIKVSAKIIDTTLLQTDKNISFWVLNEDDIQNDVDSYLIFPHRTIKNTKLNCSQGLGTIFIPSIVQMMYPLLYPDSCKLDAECSFILKRRGLFNDESVLGKNIILEHYYGEKSIYAIALVNNIKSIILNLKSVKAN